MTGASILAGLVTAEVVHKLSQKLDSTDEEVQQLLSGDEVTEEDLKQAIEMVSEDQSKLEKMFHGLRDTLLEEGKDEQKVEQGLEAFRAKMA